MIDFTLTFLRAVFDDGFSFILLRRELPQLFYCTSES